MADGPTKMKTPEFRGSFVNLFEARAINQGKPKFGLTMVLPKDHPFWDKLRKAIDEEAVNKFGRIPKGLKTPIKDGDTYETKDGETRSEWLGCYFVKIESYDRPGVVDSDVDDITDRSEVYSGAYYKATFRPGGWDHPTGGKGVSLWLDNVMKTRDGETFSGKKSATDDFADHVRDGSDGDGSDGGAGSDGDDDPMS